MTGSGEPDTSTADRRRWRTEFLAFLVLAFGVWPFVAVAVVGAFGFAVWMLQLVFGPPGPPSALH